uniref:Uncharacterized protein n=1 Tax=uncultured prokaryote TaxID=198431 RepID=A0A0H5Q5M6_9ZZZZ|nr:hypothetical protein [uncultured prokaryote]
MIERTVVSVSTDIRRDHQGLLLQVTVTYCESSLGGGQMKKEVDRYGPLTVQELQDIVEVITTSRLPGQVHAFLFEPALFQV